MVQCRSLRTCVSPLQSPEGAARSRRNDAGNRRYENRLDPHLASQRPVRDGGDDNGKSRKPETACARKSQFADWVPQPSAGRAKASIDSHEPKPHRRRVRSRAPSRRMCGSRSGSAPTRRGRNAGSSAGNATRARCSSWKNLRNRLDLLFTEKHRHAAIFFCQNALDLPLP